MVTMTAAEYSDSVREWLTQAYHWQAIAYCKSNTLNMFYKERSIKNAFDN